MARIKHLCSAPKARQPTPEPHRAQAPPLTLAFRQTERARSLSQHFDRLVRAADGNPRDVPRWLVTKAGETGRVGRMRKQREIGIIAIGSANDVGTHEFCPFSNTR